MLESVASGLRSSTLTPALSLPGQEGEGEGDSLSFPKREGEESKVRLALVERTHGEVETSASRK